MEAYIEDISKGREDRATNREAKKTAERMIRDGEMPLDKILRYVPSLSMDELKELEAKVMQLA